MKLPIESKIFIESYGLATALGDSVNANWNALIEKRDVSQSLGFVPFEARGFLWADRNETKGSNQTLLVRKLVTAFKNSEPPADLKEKRIGLILASTKSSIDDQIWNENPNLEQDFFTPIIRGFCEQTQISPERWITVSNACASGLSALFLGRKWLDYLDLDHVIILACDTVGKFVVTGFHALKALSTDRVRPFDPKRTGLQIGDGAAFLLLSKNPPKNSKTRMLLNGVGIDAEGFAVTRPGLAGKSLVTAIKNAVRNNEPIDFILAHSTATAINDPIEDQAFSSVFPTPLTPWVTGTKGAIGHTLGASSAIDVIFACEVLKRQELFPFTHTRSIGQEFKGNFVLDKKSQAKEPWLNGLVSSLGFGGIHAAASIGLEHADT